MPRTIVQRVKLTAGPRDLFETYLDSARHSAATGARAKISRKAGARFSAWNGYIQGKTLHVVPGKLVVQTWRGSDFREDSILMLRFDEAPGGGRITMVHANVPDERAASIAKGWHDYYWKPWRAYLRSHAKKKRSAL